MSRIVVTPPAAAARVAVANPSHSVRPGSLMCTWVSTRPGRRISSSARSMISGVSRAMAADRLDRRDPAVPDDDGTGEDSVAGQDLTGDQRRSLVMEPFFRD